MATIGCLGDVAFTVSDSVIRTLSNFQWSGSARYATHQRHLGRGLLEFTGTDPDKISFDITLSAQLGVTPAKEIARIAKYVSSGKKLPLTIGNLYVAVLSVSLQEYLRR